VLALRVDATLAEADLSRSGDSLVEGGDLETMVLLSLWCDAPAREGDPSDPLAPRAGWWADALETNGDIWGSRLWLLKRAKLTKDTVTRAKAYVDEALAWMVVDRIAERVESIAEIRKIGPGIRALYVGATIYRPQERTPIAAGPWSYLQEAA
jgi:phage gp46-like protein